MKATSKTRVEGDEGLVIQLDRGKIKYSLNGMHINIEIEHGVGDISIYAGSIKKWFPPHADLVIDEQVKSKIVDDVCEALSLLGIGCRVE